MFQKKKFSSQENLSNNLKKVKMFSKSHHDPILANDVLYKQR